MARPTIFFDSSVCIDVARKNIPPEEWAFVYRRLFNSFRYCISPLTVYELVSGLDTGDEQHFRDNQEVFRILYPTRRITILPLLRTFVSMNLFGEKLPVPHSLNTDFHLWIKAILKAETRASLESGKLRISLKGRKGFGLVLSDINSQMRVFQDGYAKLFTRLREQGAPELTAEIWADFVLRDLRKTINTENRNIVLNRLDAAYAFACSLWGFMRNESYDFRKHRTEIVDAQQLYYLCNSRLYFLTNERKLKTKIAKSAQGERILLFQELEDILSK
jgi:hypothetical protein